MQKIYITTFIDEDDICFGPCIFAESIEEAIDIANIQNLSIQGELHQMLLTDMKDFVQKRVIH